MLILRRHFDVIYDEHRDGALGGLQLQSELFLDRSEDGRAAGICVALHRRGPPVRRPRERQVISPLETGVVHDDSSQLTGQLLRQGTSQFRESDAFSGEVTVIRGGVRADIGMFRGLQGRLGSCRDY